MADKIELSEIEVSKIRSALVEQIDLYWGDQWKAPEKVYAEHPAKGRLSRAIEALSVLDHLLAPETATQVAGVISAGKLLAIGDRETLARSLFMLSEQSDSGSPIRLWMASTEIMEQGNILSCCRCAACALTAS